MKNRNVEFFNLSFLDLLSGALAAIIFLFIIVPKGDITLTDDPVMVTYDTLQQKFYGTMPDVLLNKEPGDTLLAIVGNLEGIPIAKAAPETPESTLEPIAQKSRRQQARKEEPQKEEQQVTSNVTVEASKFQGSRPDVPAKVSIEMKWANKRDNVDLYVCKDGACVYGGKRHRDFIGFWDSGKSRTGLFGSDLRTNQEAVRQFDEIIPGTYDIEAQFKESNDGKSEIPVRLQVYTKNDDNVERGTDEYYNLPLNPHQKTRIARVTIGPEGEIEFQSLK